MKMIVRRTALAVCTLVLALILPTAASAACAGFDDVPETADCYESVMYLAEHKITQGTGNGCFSPDAPVTTSQWVNGLSCSAAPMVWKPTEARGAN